jgi:desulfoferrodoxin (superoxide reductase-like protein)
MAGSALGGLGRFVIACAPEDRQPADRRTPTPSTPTDGDEFKPPNGNPPINGGDTPPTVPNQVWESRARQLEEEQTRTGGPVFTAEAPGKWAGKERSHVPVATVTTENGLKKVTILVQHVMGANLVDAGAGDSGEGGTDAAADVADADAGDTGDAGQDAEADAGAGTAPIIHYITTMYLRASVNGVDTVVGLWEFKSDDAAPPSVKLTLPVGVTEVTAYEWCTLHGLWKAAPLPV